MMTEEHTRLHITPFNPSILNAILPPSILPNARNISYHDIQTFPEKSYGYVDLPIMDAEKIKKKLNGAILKGTKIKIDKARPQKEVATEEAVAEVERPKKEKKKRKRDVLPGVDIGDRHVKRGWTTPVKDIPKEKANIIPKSKFTTGPECLFKTVLPPNVVSRGKILEISSEKPDKPERKKRKLGKEAVVHEFTKTTKYATFLRSSSGPGKTKAATEYVEDKGWVDEDGNVIEAAVKPRRSKLKSKKQKEVQPPKVESEQDSLEDIEDEDSMPVDTKEKNGTRSATEDEGLAEVIMQDAVTDDVIAPNDTSDESSAGEADTSEEGSIPAVEAVTIESVPSLKAADEELEASLGALDEELEAISSGSEESSSSDEDSDDEDAQSPTPASSRPQSAAGPALTIQIPESSTSTPIATSVHPLEALYKRSKKEDSSTPKPEASAFSFFGADDIDDDLEEEDHMQIPLTPYTQKDFEYRGIRSAAPTPDTTHANKKFLWPSKDDEDEDEDDEHVASSPTRNSGQSKEKDAKTGEETDFQKWFWENRGNVNRAWKKRKRTVSKEKRQRESKKRHVA